MPQSEAAHPVPLNPQVTEVLLDPVTVALNCCCAPASTDGSEGETVTPICDGAAIVAVVEPEMAPFVSDVAFTVTVFGDGAVAGAVYNPVEEIEPHVIPEQPAPEILHSTTPLCGPLALNCT